MVSVRCVRCECGDKMTYYLGLPIQLQIPVYREWTVTLTNMSSSTAIPGRSQLALVELSVL